METDAWAVSIVEGIQRRTRRLEFGMWSSCI